MQSAQPSSERTIGDYHRLFQPDCPWEQAAFPLPDGSRWEYREPAAVVLVRNGDLQVSAVPYTRSNDRVQILDNAKHMYFSKERFEVPEGGRITFEISIAARTFGTEPGNLYDGYVSWNLLDLTTGWALDFFTGGDSDRDGLRAAALPRRGSPRHGGRPCLLLLSRTGRSPHRAGAGAFLPHHLRPGPRHRRIRSGRAGRRPLRTGPRQDSRFHCRAGPHVGNRHRRRQVRELPRPGRDRSLEPHAGAHRSSAGEVTQFDPRIGLCSACEHARTVRSGRGSTFSMCELSRTDPRFRKYPPLPVSRCQGFAAVESPGDAPQP